METNPFDYKKMRSQISLKFGIELDETSLAILHILTLNQIGISNIQNKKIDDAAKGINQAKKSLEVSKDKPKLQAFWFGFGLWGVSACVFILSAWSCILYWDNTKSQQLLLPEQIKWYRAYYETLKDLDKKNTKEFLKIYPQPNQ